MVNRHVEEYDRAKEVKQFDDTKAGVKGLVDSGITSIPRIFHHPPDTLLDLKPDPKARNVSPPVIDLSGFDSDRRPTIVEQVSRAAREIGFFQIVNHGIQLEVMDRTVAAVKGFHEQPTEAKARLYSRDRGEDILYWSNVDLYLSDAASWRDTLWMRLSTELPVGKKIIEVCGDVVAEWDREVSRVGDVVLGLLEEGLGLSAGRCRELLQPGSKAMVGQYYPYCPEPDRTLGIRAHTDPGMLTLLAQDQIGGLQIKSGGLWVDVESVPGALVINIGDLLQIMSNDEYQSVDHRVLANSCAEARVAVAVFLKPSEKSEEVYGPLPELTLSEKPAVYQYFTYFEYLKILSTTVLGGKSLKNYFRI